MELSNMFLKRTSIMSELPSTVTSRKNPHSIEIGQITYDENKPLGDGATSDVYEGTFQDLAVAVKKFEKRKVKDFRREESILSIVDGHENVVQFFGKEEDGRCCYLALTLCKTDLAHAMRNPSLCNLDVITVLEQATKGIEYIHLKTKNKPSIAHRDIKPNNILIFENSITGQQKVMVADFGLSKKTRPDTSYISVQSGVGTRGWKAPELMKMEDDGNDGHSKKVTVKVDIFSLGCIFYHTSTQGKHPFGKERIREGNIEKGEYNLDDLDENEYPDSHALIENMISFDPNKRPKATDVLMDPMFKNKNRGLLKLGKAIIKSALGVCCSFNGHSCRFIQSFHSDIGAIFFRSVRMIIGRDWVKKIRNCLLEGKIAYDDGIVVLSGTHGALLSGANEPTTALTDMENAESEFIAEDEHDIKKLKKDFPNHREIELVDVAAYHLKSEELKKYVLAIKPKPKYIVFAFCESNYCKDITQLFARQNIQATKLPPYSHQQNSIQAKSTILPLPSYNSQPPPHSNTPKQQYSQPPLEDSGTSSTSSSSTAEQIRQQSSTVHGGHPQQQQKFPEQQPAGLSVISKPPPQVGKKPHDSKEAIVVQNVMENVSTIKSNQPNQPWFEIPEKENVPDWENVSHTMDTDLQIENEQLKKMNLKVRTKALPPAPPKLNCINFNHNSIKLKWGDVKDSIAANYILENENTRKQWFQIYNGPGHYFKANKLNENTEYRYRIAAMTDAGQGPFSTAFNFKTAFAHPGAVRAAPRVSQTTDSTSLVEWGAVRPVAKGDQLRYQLELTKVKNEIIIKNDAGTDLQFRFQCLEAKSEYTVRVAAVRTLCGAETTSLVGPLSPASGFTTLVKTTSTSVAAPQASYSARRPRGQRFWSDKEWAMAIMGGFTVYAIVLAFICQQLFY